MGFKSKEIIIGAPLVLNEFPNYRDKMIMLATFRPLGMNPVRVASLLGMVFSWGRLFVGDLTASLFP